MVDYSKVDSICFSYEFPTYALACLELLENTTESVSPGVVILHSILTNNAIGVFPDLTVINSLGNRYPAIYQKFIQDRKKAFLFPILNSLAKRASLSNDKDYVNRQSNLPVPSHIHKLIYSLNYFGNINDLDHLKTIEMTVKAYISSNNYNNGNYITELESIMHNALFFVSDITLDHLISVTKIFTYLSYSKENAYSSIYDTEAQLKDFTNVIGSHKLFHMEDKIKNEALICSGMEHVSLLPFCTDPETRYYTKEGKNYLAATLYLLRHRISSFTRGYKGKIAHDHRPTPNRNRWVFS